MGLAEIDWVRQYKILSTPDIEYEDFIECAKRMTTYLRETAECDIVIALTHMRDVIISTIGFRL